MIGIICTMLNGFGARGLYNSQEIGLGKAVAALTLQKVVIYKAVRQEDVQDIEQVNENVTIKYIRCPRVGNAHGILDTRQIDTKWKGERMNALICFCDQQIFIPHIYHFCKKNGIQMLFYTGIIRSNRGGANSVISDLLFRLGTKRLYKRVHVAAKTKGVSHELFAIGAGNVPVAPVGMDFSTFHSGWKEADREKLRKGFSFEPDDKVVLCISRMEKEKHIMDLIPLAIECKQSGNKIKFLVIGSGRQSEEFRQQITANHLEDSVRVIDKIPHDEIWKAYVAADYFINLCRVEIFGMAIMEAIYYETPVVAFHAYGPDTILENMDGSRTVGGMPQMVQFLLGPYPAKETLSRDARVLTKKYTWTNAAKVMLNLLGIVYYDPAEKPGRPYIEEAQ